MNKTKAFDLLTTLSIAEQKSFSLYLKNHYATTKHTVRIFKYFQKKQALADQNPEVFEIGYVYKKLFKIGMDEKKKKSFQNSIYSLEDDLHNFLLREKLKESTFEKDQLLLQIYQERKKPKLFFNKIRQMKKAVEEAPIKEQWDSYKLMRIKHQAYFNNYTEKIDHSIDDIPDIMEDASLFYVNKMLIFHCELVARKMVNSESYDPSSLKTILEILKQSKQKNSLRSQLYQLSYQLNLNQSEATFIELKTFLESNIKSLDSFDINIAFTYLNNMLSFLMKKGNQNYIPIFFNLYKLGVSYKAFVHQGYFNPVAFQNIVTLSALEGNFDWALVFIESNKNQLVETLKADVINTSYAFLFFKEKKFSKTISFLRNVKFRNILYSIKSKGLILRSYYELNENNDLIEGYIQSFSQFLQTQNNFNQIAINGYLSLIKYIRLLRNGEMSKSQIIAQINDEKALTFKSWLLEKADEL